MNLVIENISVFRGIILCILSIFLLILIIIGIVNRLEVIVIFNSLMKLVGGSMVFYMLMGYIMLSVSVVFECGLLIMYRKFRIIIVIVVFIEDSIVMILRFCC